MNIFWMGGFRVLVLWVIFKKKMVPWVLWKGAMASVAGKFNSDHSNYALQLWHGKFSNAFSFNL
jgi:hypothetical protein